MSLDKAIKYNKEKRKEYKGAKAVDISCRNHGSCPWCIQNRLFKSKRRELIVDEDWELEIWDSEES